MADSSVPPAVDLAYLISIFPELTGTPSALVDALNAIAVFYVDALKFGAGAQYAAALVVAHFIKLDSLRGAGAVTSDRVGDLAQTYQAMPITQAMSITSYGQRFLEFSRMALGVPAIYTSGGNQLPPPFGGPGPTWPSDARRF